MLGSVRCPRTARNAIGMAKTICISSPGPGRGSRPLPGLYGGSADDHVDLYGCVLRELVDAQGRSGVAAGVA